MSARQTWEYALLVLATHARQEAVSKIPGAERDWVYYQDFYISLPEYDEPRKLKHWKSTDRDTTHHSILELLNGLGAEGWEAISDAVVSSGLNLHTRAGAMPASHSIGRSC